MEKLIITIWAYSKHNGASNSTNIEFSSKEELESGLKEFEDEVEFSRYYMESTLSPASRPATDEELAWLNDSEDIGFDGVNND